MLSKNLKETAEFAVSFVKNYIKDNGKGALVVALSGDLGSGKTAFTKEIAKTLGVKRTVTSPTFVIMKNYALTKKGVKIKNKHGYQNMIHIDAYRLEDPKELLNLGWGEITKDKNNIIFIEWPEKVKKIMPKDHLCLKFKFIDENTREITLRIPQGK